MDLAFSIFVVVGVIFTPTPVESSTLNRHSLYGYFNDLELRSAIKCTSEGDCPSGKKCASGYCIVTQDESVATPAPAADTDSRDWLVVQVGKTLEESVLHCQGLGREMVSILSEDDANHFADITKDIDTSGSEHGYIRIGLESPNADCQWSWIGTTEAFNPGNWFWQGNEPNGCRGKELCAQTGRGSKKWNDSKCYYKTYFVCGNPEVHIFKFNETCCEAKGVREECMGLCRERINRRSIDVYPVDRCVEHQNDITSCLYEYVPAVDCEWNDWQIGECSKTCAGGSRTNSRTKKIEESNGTDENGVCEGEATMDEDCNTQNCPPIHCEWNDWVLGECSDSCGTGTRTNTRTKSVFEANGGTCTGQPSEIEECNTDPCPIDCVWDDWQLGDCDKSCGGGLLTKTRVPKVNAQHEGENCTGHSTVTESCNVQECPVHCEWGDWVIGECSKTCGGGVQIDSRGKLQEELFDGNPCEGDATRQRECNTDQCPIVYKFDETCCTNSGVPEECMGLCREKTDRDVQVILPINRCEEHRDTIRTCMKIEGEGCFEYLGRYDGICQSDGPSDNDWTNYYKMAKKTSQLPDVETLPPNDKGHKLAEAYCNSKKDCIGYGQHYSIDRYYFAGDEIQTLKCNDADGKSCGNGEPTNGCYVKAPCGTTTPVVIEVGK